MHLIENPKISYFYLGEGKVKNEQGQRRSRQVLGDIGNVEVVRIAEAKQITRPITRLTPLSLSLSPLSLSPSPYL
jgi:hypothetical protein